MHKYFQYGKRATLLFNNIAYQNWKSGITVCNYNQPLFAKTFNLMGIQLALIALSSLHRDNTDQAIVPKRTSFQYQTNIVEMKVEGMKSQRNKIMYIKSLWTTTAFGNNEPNSLSDKTRTALIKLLYQSGHHFNVKQTL